MSKLIVTGGKKLSGEISVEGAKNSVLPILAATVLNGGINILENCPKLKDVELIIEILRKLGCLVEVENNKMIIDSSTMNTYIIPEDLATEMRSSIVFMGSVLARMGKIMISYPGGCEIGPRPIDLHLKALRCMGAKLQEVQGGFIYGESDKLKGCDIHLDYPSVGATENIMLAAVYADGDTYIRNAAKEPEIVDLQNFLNAAGSDVTGAGTSIIKIKGTNKKLKDVKHRIIPDRIVAGTYMTAAAITGGNITLKNVMPEHLSSIISILRECGCHISSKGNTLHISGPVKPKAVEIVRTLPYPGFPTDMQAQLVSLLSVAKGTSIVVETIFENRYMHVDELLRMGASIKLEGRLAVIKGVKKLMSANVCSRDLRGGAALVLAGLAAEGDTVITGLKHIDRGYEEIETKLALLGAKIKRVD